MNVVLFFYLILNAPKLFFDRLKGKRHPAFLQRLGFGLPRPNRSVIWIHAVSVGEVKAAQPLFQALKSEEHFFFITTTTATGQTEARRSLSGADHFAYLPIDFTWSVRKFVKALNPKHFILVESDFWPNLLRELKKNGTKISLVSGKMSERSFRRFNWFSFYAKCLFALFDHICVQNEEHLQRFLPFVDPSRLHQTGNLKLDLKPQLVSKKLDLVLPVIAISCTHNPEEEWILDALSGGDWRILLAPRHPERFEEVANLLKKKQIPFTRLSDSKMNKIYRLQEGIVLIDAMGQLPICYTNSQLAILGGSFVDSIGGHNVLEPCLYGTPVFFGPYMHAQKEFAKRVLELGAGLQISIHELRDAVERFFKEIGFQQTMREKAFAAAEMGRGATERTLAIIRPLA